MTKRGIEWRCRRHGRESARRIIGNLKVLSELSIREMHGIKGAKGKGGGLKEFCVQACCIFGPKAKHQR
ncbi:MAG TPA: hypothetical protein V6D17_11695 [Candidatus Obscuribacterales bacterium]